jgi:putative aldouronate transport system substrate-binding protein
LRTISPCDSQGTQNNPSASANSAGGTSAPSGTGEPITLDWCFSKSGFESPPEPDVILERILEETGVWLNRIVPPAASYNEQVAVIMASNNLPDVIRFGSMAIMADYAEQGALRPLNDLLDSMPTVVNSIDERAFETCSLDDNLYAIPVVTSEHATISISGRTGLTPSAWKNRVHWKNARCPLRVHLQRSGRQRREGHLRIQRRSGGDRFERLLPDGLLHRLFWCDRRCKRIFLCGRRRSSPSQAINPKAKEALQLLNEWYKEGLIDPEFTVLTAAELDERPMRTALALQSDGGLPGRSGAQHAKG